MPRQLEIPDSPTLAEIDLDVSTKNRETGDEISDTFKVKVPKSLADAISRDGETEVFRRYINSVVIAEQGTRRQELLRDGTAGSSKRRAKYLETLGL